MAEELVLTDPIQPAPPPPTTKYKVLAMLTDREAPTPAGPGLVRITVADDQGLRSYPEYTGAEAIDLMRWMNTANFSVNSMQKRVLQKLSGDGKLPPGTVTGTPDPPAGE